MRTPVGPNLLLFQRERPARNLVISAHGGFIAGTPKVLLRFADELHWYCKHNENVTDENIENFVFESAKVTAQWCETTLSGHYHYDYALSKYQGALGEKHEHYEQIEELLSHNTKLDAARAKGAFLSSGTKRARDDVDILTIQSQPGMPDVTLSSTLDNLSRSGHNYYAVHCYFCRS